MNFQKKTQEPPVHQRWNKYFPFCEPVFWLPKFSAKLCNFQPNMPCKITPIIVISRQKNVKSAYKYEYINGNISIFAIYVKIYGLYVIFPNIFCETKQILQTRFVSSLTFSTSVIAFFHVLLDTWQLVSYKFTLVTLINFASFKVQVESF